MECSFRNVMLSDDLKPPTYKWHLLSPLDHTFDGTVKKEYIVIIESQIDLKHSDIKDIDNELMKIYLCLQNIPKRLRCVQAWQNSVAESSPDR